MVQEEATKERGRKKPLKDCDDYPVMAAKNKAKKSSQPAFHKLSFVWAIVCIPLVILLLFKALLDQGKV